MGIDYKSLMGSVFLSAMTFGAAAQNESKNEIPLDHENAENVVQADVGASSLMPDRRNIKIANFKSMYKTANQQYDDRWFYDGDVDFIQKAGNVRFDFRSISDRHTFSGSLFKSDFFHADLLKHSSIIGEEMNKPAEMYEGSVYFKKAFVHEIDTENGLANGGGTLSAPLDSSFNAKDGRGFTQINIDKMVKLAAESKGFAITLNFNADEDGDSIRYTDDYLDANGGRVRKALESQLAGTGIAYEGRNANDVLSDFRGYVVEQQIKASAITYYSERFDDQDQVKQAVDDFMSVKFNKNAEKKSFGASHATKEGHDQVERAVNLSFQEYEEHDHVKDHEHKYGELDHNGVGDYNHTHIGYLKDLATTGGRYNSVLTNETDEGTFIVVEPKERRMEALKSMTNEEALDQMLEIRMTKNVVNTTVDNQTYLILTDGHVTSSYNADKDHIEVSIDGKPYAKITWYKPLEDIDPSRIMVGKINHDGVGYAEKADNISSQLSHDRRTAAGITPLTDAMEYTAWLSTECKNMYLDSGKNLDKYKGALKRYGIDKKLDKLADHYTKHAGINGDTYINAFKKRYVTPESESGEDLFDPVVVMDDDWVAYELARYYPELGVDVNETGKGSVKDRVNATYQTLDTGIADFTQEQQKMQKSDNGSFSKMTMD